MCQVPHPDDMLEVQNIILVKSLQSLEKGTFTCFFAPKKSNGIFLYIYSLSVTFCGSLFLKVGDDPGQRASMQLLGPNSKFPSRYFQDNPASKFSNVVHPSKRIHRNLEEHLGIINYIQTHKNCKGHQGKCKELAKQYGLTTEISPLWNLNVFSSNFFFNHSNCLLHLEKEGMLVRWIGNFGRKYGKKFCKRINAKLDQVSSSLPAHYFL